MAVLLFAALVLAPALGCLGRTREDPFLLGHISALSGPDKDRGEAERQGVLLAVEEANKAPGLPMGRRLAVLHVDDKGDAELVQPFAVRLVTINRVAALLGGYDDEQADRIGRAVRAHDTTVLSFASMQAASVADNAFSLNVSLAARIDAVSRFLKEESKAEKALLLVDARADRFIQAADLLARELGPAASRQAYRNDRERLQAIEAAAKAKLPMIVHIGPRADLVAVAQAGIPLLYFPGSEVVADLPATKVPIYEATIWDWEIANDTGREFAKKYQDRFHLPASEPAVLAYESVRALADLISRSAPTAASRLRADLLITGGLTQGMRLEKSRTALRPIAIVKQAEGQRSLVKRYEPKAP